MLKLDGDMAQNLWSVSLEKGTGDLEKVYWVMHIL